MGVLVTGGAGYIGSHAVKQLLTTGERVVVLDNFCCGHLGALERLRTLPHVGSALSWVQGDLSSPTELSQILRKNKISAVMHFAALSSVGESVQQPLRYYTNNVAGSVNLIQACFASEVEKFVFSSTASTYGQPDPANIPITERCPQQPINPYGASKLMVERVLLESASAATRDGRRFACAILRYFNVAGADPQGILGEDHRPESHLIPCVLGAIRDGKERLTINGSDYPTPDGSCVRDYVHVSDLAGAHVAVMNAMQPGEQHVYNLGIGRPYSVREVIAAACRVTGKHIAIEVGPRRAGDPAALYADPALIHERIGWKASITDLDEIIASAWRWMLANPKGYTVPMAPAMVEPMPVRTVVERAA